MHLYTIYDTKAETYSPPVVLMNDQVARRSLELMVREEDRNQINANPEDFVLFRIGDWNPSTGNITPAAGTCIAKAIEFVN